MNTPVLVLPSQGPPFGMRNQYVNSMAQFETSGFRDWTANEYLKYLKAVASNQSKRAFILACIWKSWKAFI